MKTKRRDSMAEKRSKKAERMNAGQGSDYAQKQTVCRPQAMTVCPRHAQHMRGVVGSDGKVPKDCGICVGQPA